MAVYLVLWHSVVMVWNWLKANLLAPGAAGTEPSLDAMVQECTIESNRLKVAVAKIIKEQRDLQEQIHRRTQERTQLLLELNRERTSPSVDGPCAFGEIESKVMAIEGRIDDLNHDLTEAKAVSEEIIAAVQSIEFALGRIGRHRIFMSAYEAIASARDVLSGIERLVPLSTPDPDDKAIEDLRLSVRRMHEHIRSIEHSMQAFSLEKRRG